MISADLLHEREKIAALEEKRKKPEHVEQRRAPEPPIGTHEDVIGMLMSPGWGLFIQDIVQPYIKGKRGAMFTMDDLPSVAIARSRIIALRDVLVKTYDMVDLKLPEQIAALFE